jgi:hypothetical protein
LGQDYLRYTVREAALDPLAQFIGHRVGRLTRVIFRGFCIFA